MGGKDTVESAANSIEWGGEYMEELASKEKAETEGEAGGSERRQRRRQWIRREAALRMVLRVQWLAEAPPQTQPPSMQSQR